MKTNISLKIVQLFIISVILLSVIACDEDEDTFQITPDNTDMIYFRTNQQSFNYWYYGMIYDGNLYVKPNEEQSGNTGDWELVYVPDELMGNAVSLSMDDDNIVVMKNDRKLFRCGSTYLVDMGQENSIYNWGTYNSYPFNNGPVFYLPENVLDWDYSVVSIQLDENYTDHVGNTFPVGEAKCSHIVALKEGNNYIAFNDIWLPPDLNFEVCSPYRGRFKAVSLSASGSVYFIMNQYGDMFTTMFDYDISGPDRLLMEYSYYDQTQVAEPVHQLPAESWTMHTKINGRITDLISIHKIGVDCIHRIMRVEGWNANGETGFYEKDIIDDEWTFVVTGQPIMGNEIGNTVYDSSEEDLAELEDVYFNYNMDNLSSLSESPPAGDFTTDDWAAELLDYNCYCSPVQLRVHLSQNDSIDLTLYTTETLRTTARTTRGLDDEPRNKDGNIEVPLSILDNISSYSDKAQAFISFYFDNQQFNWAPHTISTSEVDINIEGTPYDWLFTR